jgi:hypothetical protein
MSSYPQSIRKIFIFIFVGGQILAQLANAQTSADAKPIPLTED